MRYQKSLLFLTLFIILLSFTLADEHTRISAKMMTPRIQRAIEDGHKFLAKKQNRDGSFGPPDKKFAISITSFACLSFMAAGNLPHRGQYGKNVALGLNYITSIANKGTGYISTEGEESKMHGHGYATLFLVEVYGMSANEEMRERLRRTIEKAVECILSSQTVEGGWGYYPGNFQDHEGSITVCQLQALRAARNVGIRVPKKHIERAISYLKQSANPNGTFKYRLGMVGGRNSFPLTAAGVSSLNAIGEYDAPEAKKGLEYMMKYLPPSDMWMNDRYYQAFYYYAHFYAAQAMYQAPLRYWRQWFPAISNQFLKLQNPTSGAWGDKETLGYGTTNYGRSYATAIATLVLQIPYNYLPIFQR